MAEVLITLGIIGVVAAMTLPTLITKYKFKVYETAFKKQYSVLNNTINFLQLDEGLEACYMTLDTTHGVSYSANIDDCYVLKQGIINKLNLKPINNTYPYASKSKVLSDGGIAINSSYVYDYARYYFSAFILPDGAIIRFSFPRCDDYDYYNISFVLDINGLKGPNKWGYDVFYLTLSSNNGKLRLSDEWASLAEKGGRLPRTILQNKEMNDTPTWLW